MTQPANKRLVTEAALTTYAAAKWQPIRAYSANDLVLAPDGTIIQRNANGTSRASYDATEQALWTVKSSGGAVASVNSKTGAVVLSASDVGADASGAATAAQAAAVQRANHTGTQSADTLTDGTTNKAFLATERTKLGGVATGATANSTDAQLRDRSTHTGTQAASTVTGLAAVATSGAKADVGLDQVTNTSDLAKRISLKKPAPRLVAPYKPFARAAQTGHGFTGGTADDTSVKLIGDRSYRITTNGTGTKKFVDSPTVTAVDMSKTSPRVLVNIDAPTRLTPAATGDFTLYAYTSAGNAFGAYISPDAVANTWLPLTVPRAMFGVAVGTPSWSSITYFELAVQDNSTGAVNVWYHGVDGVYDYSHLFPNGVLIVEFDDLYASQKTLAIPLLDQLGIPATINPVVERVGATSTVTAADLQAWQANGHEISCHAYAGAVHDAAATAAIMDADNALNQQWLVDNGLGGGSLEMACCPGTGSPVTDATKMAALRARFRSVRQNSGLFETVQPGDPHRFRSVLFTGNTNAQLQTNIDKTAGAGGCLTLAFHEVLTGSTNGTASGLAAIAVNNLKTVLQYAQSKGMVCLTRGQLADAVGF